MLFKKSLLVLCVFFLFSKANAQEFKLGKVSVAELQEKEHPKDSSAVAAILFKKGETRFEYSDIEGFVMITKVQTRIKIYKKDGNEWANHEVRYYLGNKISENVLFSDAITYNLVDGKIEKSKLKSDGLFDQKINKYWGQKKIAMPNVKEGSIIEFEYTIRSKNIGSFRNWDFQTSIPVNYSEYKTYIPEYFVYNANQKGFISPKVTVEKSNGSFIINSKERTSEGSGLSAVTNTVFSSDKIDFLETRTTYLEENLPAMKEEVYVNNTDNYTSSISFELSMTKYPNQPLKMYSTDWKSVVKTIYEYDDFGPELNKTGYFENDINTLIKGLNTPEEKVAAIFNFVKTNVKWNSFKGYSCDDGVKKAYKDKTGNVAEINLMLTSMLRFAGLTADPVLISTRDNGIAFFPNRTAFNYVIAAVETPEGLILLDATEKYAEPNILPLRDINWIGRLIRKDGTSTEVDLMPKQISKVVSNVNIVLNSNGTIDGKIRRQFVNYKAFEFRKENILTAKDTYVEQLEHQNNNIEINDYSRENEVDLSKPIVEVFSFKDNKDIENINGKIYISPLLFLVTKENPFKQEVRDYPVDFGYPLQNKFNINIEIPEGYIVESMPVVMNIATAENMGSFKYVIGSSGNKIQVLITKEINVPIVSADYYEIIKTFYQQMVDKQNEKIVLKKI